MSHFAFGRSLLLSHVDHGGLQFLELLAQFTHFAFDFGVNRAFFFQLAFEFFDGSLQLDFLLGQASFDDVFEFHFVFLSGEQELKFNPHKRGNFLLCF